MHVCVAQAPAGKIDWSNNEQKCLLAFSVSGAIWADDVQVANRPLTCHRELKQHVALYSPCCRPTRVDGRYLEKRPILRITRSDG